MKSTKLLFALLLGLLCVPMNTEAQFLKELKKKAENAAKEVVLNKAEVLARRETEKAMDKMLDMSLGEGNSMATGSTLGSTKDLPVSYDFTWRYGMKFETSKAKDNMNITYYFKEDAPYWGAEFNQEMQMFMVFDNAQNLIAMYTTAKGESFVTVTNIPEPTVASEVTFPYDDYTVTELPPREIMGYPCKGYTFENDEYVYTLYLTFKTPVSFSDIYGKSNKIPKGFNKDWLKEGDNEGLMMEMMMEDKKSRKNNIKMSCVLLEQNPFELKKKDYNSLGQN